MDAHLIKILCEKPISFAIIISSYSVRNLNSVIYYFDDGLQHRLLHLVVHTLYMQPILVNDHRFCYF